MPNVTACYRIPDGFEGGLSIKDQSGFTATETYQVEFDAPNLSIWAALNASAPTFTDESVPRYGHQHSEDPSSIVGQKGAEPVENDLTCWRVTVNYAYPTLDVNAPSSPPPPSDAENGSGGSTGGGSGNNPPTPIPNLRRSKGTFYRQKAWDKDLANALIANAAGDPFLPPLTSEQPLLELTFVRSQSTFDVAWSDDFEGSVNDAQYSLLFSGTLIVCAAKTLKCLKITADEVPATENTPSYWTVTIVVQRDPQGWQPQPLNRGFRQLVGGVLDVIRDKKSGMPVTEPALLAANGTRLADGGVPTYVGPFKLHPERNFKWLALDK